MKETSITYLPETDYRKLMENTVEPYLKKYRKWGWYTGYDGARLFYFAYVKENAKGNIVISHGFTEFAEKYNEIVYYFLQAGYSVFMPEHRGHGRSEREIKNLEKIHVKSFEQYVWDFHVFVNKIVKPHHRDNYLFAHSMGGAIGALYLEKYPDDFKKAVLSTPMIQMRIGKIPYHTAMRIASICKLCGFGKAYAAGQRGFEGRDRFEKSCCLSKERYLYAEQMRLGCRMYQTNGADYDWVCAAAKAAKYVQNKKNIKKIGIPVLVFAAGKDHMVDNGKICKFTGKLRNARLVWVHNAKHEIVNAMQQEREQFFKEIFEFLYPRV